MSKRMQRTARALAVAFVAAPVGSVLAAPGDPLDPSGLLQVTVALVAVLAVIFAGAWVLRRFGRFNAAAGGALRVVAALPVGTRERVVLVQVGARQILLGVAPGRVQALHVLEENVGAGEAERRAPESFPERLDRAMHRGPAT